MVAFPQYLAAGAATLAQLASATYPCCDNSSVTPLTVNPIFEFPQGTYVEALQFRPNGQLLCTLLAPEAAIYQIDTVQKCAKRVVDIPSLDGLYGMVETTPDQFYVAGGNFNLLESTRDIGSFGIWHVNMTGFERTGRPTVQQVSSFETTTPNGLFTLDAAAGLILAADSTNGAVYRVNVLTGENEIIIDDPLLAPPANRSTYPSPNGLDIVNGTLYFTNTGAGIVGRIPVDENAEPTGPAETYAINAGGEPGGDDFTFDEAGNLLLAGNPNNFIGLIRPGADAPEIIAGGINSTDIMGPNVVRFGVSAEDVARGSLYIGTSGGLAQYRSGNFTMGGGVYRIDLAPLNL